jgi:hypothetical protein
MRNRSRFTLYALRPGVPMPTTTHRIAGITFRTEATAHLRRMHEDPYERFRVGNAVTPDVCHRIQRVDEDALTLPAPSKAAVQGAHRTPGALEGPLLRAPAVRERVRAALAMPTSASAWLYPDRAIVYDFRQRILDLFYVDEYGNTLGDLPPEARLHGGTGGPDEQFRLHPIPADAPRLPPLTPGERARWAQGIESMAEKLLDLPILQYAIVRATLQDGLDRGDRLRAYHYLDGVMVWNQTQDVIDFYYPVGGGRFPVLDTAEERVSSNLRQVFATFLPSFSALMVHCAGLIRHGRAALFLAPDEGGKTTVLRLAPDGHLLNDDQVIVRQEGNGFVAHGTPLGRLTDGPVHARLGGLFVLEKAPCFELVPLSPARLVETYWNEHLNYTFFLPRDLKLRAFDLAYEMCHRVPVYRMRFPKDHVDWYAIDAALA